MSGGVIVYCKKCGHKIDDTDRFCRNCGLLILHPRNTTAKSAVSQNTEPLPKVGAGDETAVLPKVDVSDETVVLPKTGVNDETVVLPKTGVSDETVVLPKTGVNDETAVLPKTGVSDETVPLPKVGAGDETMPLPDSDVTGKAVSSENADSESQEAERELQNRRIVRKIRVREDAGTGLYDNADAGKDIYGGQNGGYDDMDDDLDGGQNGGYDDMDDDLDGGQNGGYDDMDDDLNGGYDDMDDDLNDGYGDMGDGLDDRMNDDIEDVRRPVNYHTENKKKSQKPGTAAGGRKKTKKKNGIKVIVSVVIVLLAVFVLAAAIFVSWYKDKKTDAFRDEVRAYEHAMQENDAVYGEYEALLEEAGRAVEDRDLGSFSALQRQMQEAIEKMKKEQENRKTLTEMKQQYEAAFAKYKIGDTYQQTYDDAMGQLEQAIESKDERAGSEAEKELEALRMNLTADNENQIQTMINEIHKIDTASASESEKAVFEEYQNKVAAFREEGNYLEALNTLVSWKEEAASVRARIEKEEKEEKARLESERVARERELQAIRESQAQKESEARKTDDDYIFPHSDSQYLTEADILPLSAWQKKLARNEIYARHGRKFVDAELQAYFNGKSWYQGTIEPDQFPETLLNEIEKKNAALILSME